MFVMAMNVTWNNSSGATVPTKVWHVILFLMVVVIVVVVVVVVEDARTKNQSKECICGIDKMIIIK